MLNFKEKLTHIKAFIFDVDGVFSGNLYLSSSGDQLRSMNIKDGYAVQLAIKKNYPMAIITGGVCQGIRIRFEGLGVKDIYLGSNNKMEAFNEFIRKYDINPENIMYMGDDLPDYEVMKHVGIPVCPADAAVEIKEISDYVSMIKGGDGCVRDVIEQTLRAQEKWFNPDAFQW
jgi:3-deoxy-D-manno-octulosonate 8-phosphate phosphatase (KDO 8-P phosphatase)